MNLQPPGNGLTGRLEAAGFHRVGSILVVVGGLLVLAAYTVLQWFRSGSGFFGGAGRHSTFADLHDLIDQTSREVSRQRLRGHVSFGVSQEYFGWLGWLLFAGAFGCAVLAVSAVGGRHFLLRWLSAVTAASAIGLTILALNLITFEGNAPNNADAPSYGGYFGHSGIGAWSAVAGYLLVLVGSLIARGDGAPR